MGEKTIWKKKGKSRELFPVQILVMHHHHWSITCCCRGRSCSRVGLLQFGLFHPLLLRSLGRTRGTGVAVHGGTSQQMPAQVDGLVLDHRISHFAEGVGRIEKAKIGLIQFCISPPKTDMENNVIVSDYTQMDRVLREERQYILNICKQIKKSGCNVVLLQKSILRYDSSP